MLKTAMILFGCRDGAQKWSFLWVLLTFYKLPDLQFPKQHSFFCGIYKYKSDVLEQGNEIVLLVHAMQLPCNGKSYANAAAVTESSLEFYIQVRFWAVSWLQLAWMLILLRVFSVHRSIMSSWLGLGGIAGVFLASSFADSFAVSSIHT